MLNDALVDSITINSGKTGQGVRLTGDNQDSDGMMTLTSSLEYLSWLMMDEITSRVLKQGNVGHNETGFRYPTVELDWDEEPWEGVQVYNPAFGEIYLSIPAFERLMVRYFRTHIAIVEKEQNVMRNEPWWPQYIRNTNLIEQRVLSAG